MKKYIKLFLAVITTLVLSTGCVKYESTMTINKDFSLKYATIVGYKKADIISAGGDIDSTKQEQQLDEDEKKEYTKLGINVDEYDDDEIIGMKLVKKFDSIDDLTNEIDTSCELDLYNKKVENQYCFKRTKGFFFDKYQAKISTEAFKSLSSAEPGSEDNEELTNSINAAMKSATIRFILKSDVKIDNANATTIEDNTYTWDFMKDDKLEYIEFEVTRPNYLVIGISIAAGILILILLIGIIGGFILKNKENKKKQDIQDNLTTINNEQVQEAVNPVVNALLSPDGNDLNNLENK